jgi:hypothetical protein
MISNYTTNPRQLVSRKTVVPREYQRFEPELAGVPFLLDVNVRRLGAVEAREEEPIGTGNASDAGHSRPPIRSGDHRNLNSHQELS